MLQDAEASAHEALRGDLHRELADARGSSACGRSEDPPPASGDIRTRRSQFVVSNLPPASYAWQVANAVEVDIIHQTLGVGVLRTITPQVGGPRVVAGAAAPEVMLALGLSLPDQNELD